MTDFTHSGKQKIIWGCLIAVVLAVILIVVATISWSVYWYEQDNAARLNPEENLIHFHTELQSFLAAHEGRYPAGLGAEGLGELVPYLPYLRLKDDKVVEINPDIFTEHHTSYAYVATGLTEKDLDDGMPVIFEKPWNRKRIRVLLKNGRIETLENCQFNNCLQVIEYYMRHSLEESHAWENLRRNAEYINNR